MALRVLLADESSTIKKVFQLALQDYGVDVRPVNIGIDVSSVAKNFKPDIIFADVLLQKKNGYEVCSELKQDASLRAIPVVLMWSGFMELDEDKFQASQANAQLEKPFDVTALRKLVSDLVPRTQSQKLSQFLTFPKATAETERPELPPPPTGNTEEFMAVPIPKIKGGGKATTTTAAAGGDKYRLNLKPEELEPGHVAVEYDLPSEQIDMGDILTNEAEVEEFTMHENKRGDLPPPAPKTPPTTKARDAQKSERIELDSARVEAEPLEETTASDIVTLEPSLSAQSQLSEAQIEKIIRAQSAEVIEAVVWKIIPDLATQIIERELNKLLKEKDSHPI